MKEENQRLNKIMEFILSIMIGTLIGFVCYGLIIMAFKIYIIFKYGISAYILFYRNGIWEDYGLRWKTRPL